MYIAERITADEFFRRRPDARARVRRGGRRPRRRSRSEHFVARGFQVEVEHEDLGRSFRYPGAPFLMPASPWAISRRAPKVGEHDTEILGS